jgi:hypothetical protein
MRIHSLRLGLALGLLLSAAPLVAQEAASPEALAKAASEATKKGDWAAFARLMHPEALAELKRMFRPILAVEAAGPVRSTFFGIEKVEQFDALDDVAVFERLMTNLAKNVPGMAEAMASSEIFVVGSLPEGDQLAHVVYHAGAKAEGLVVSKTSVMTFRRYQGEWRALLSGNIEGLAKRLSQMAQAGQ